MILAANRKCLYLNEYIVEKLYFAAQVIKCGRGYLHKIRGAMAPLYLSYHKTCLSNEVYCDIA